MNRVLEVSAAEDVTGNQFSLAITAPDRVTFVKGTCREESRWWQDVLSVFPRMHKVRGTRYSISGLVFRRVEVAAVGRLNVFWH